MRAFIAIGLDEVIRARLAEAQERLRAARASVKWVKPELIHLTLKFLGEIEADAVEGIMGVVAQAAEGIGPFDVRVAGLGAFPPRGAPRVVWAGMEEDARLATLQQLLEAGLEPLGFPAENRPFTAHLTLGRVKDPRHAGALRTLVEAEASADFGTQRVAEILLMQSVLSPSGPTYTPLRRHAL